jgi:hypothetical protein
MRTSLLSAAVFGLFLLLPYPALAADDEPKVLVEKAIKAYGGEEKLAGIKAIQVKSKGTIDILGMSLEFTSNGVQQLSGQLKSEIQMEIMGNQITVVQICDGKKGWLKVADNVMELEGDLLKEMQDQVRSTRINTLVPLLKDKSYTLAPIGEVKVNGKPALGIKVSVKDHKDIDLYFDKESGMVVKLSRQALDTSTMKEVMQEVIFSDFKTTDGYKHPTKMTMNHDGRKLLDLEITEYKIVEPVKDSEFGKP